MFKRSEAFLPSPSSVLYQYYQPNAPQNRFTKVFHEDDSQQIQWRAKTAFAMISNQRVLVFLIIDKYVILNRRRQKKMYK